VADISSVLAWAFAGRDNRVGVSSAPRIVHNGGCRFGRNHEYVRIGVRPAKRRFHPVPKPPIALAHPTETPPA